MSRPRTSGPSSRPRPSAAPWCRPPPNRASWVSAPPADDAAKAALQKQIDDWQKTAARYRSEPKTGEGSEQLAERAKHAEQERDEATAKYHHFELGSAAFQISIVLASAAIITGMMALAWVSGLLDAGRHRHDGARRFQPASAAFALGRVRSKCGCPLPGVKQTSVSNSGMSRLDPKQTSGPVVTQAQFPLGAQSQSAGLKQLHKRASQLFMMGLGNCHDKSTRATRDRWSELALAASPRRRPCLHTSPTSLCLNVMPYLPRRSCAPAHPKRGKFMCSSEAVSSAHGILPRVRNRTRASGCR